MKKTLFTLMLASMLALSPSAQQTLETKEKKKPKATYQVGTVKIAVWENKNSEGKTWKSYQVQNSYKKDGVWKTSNNYTATELLQLKAVIDKAISEEAVKEK